jgi:inner membrane protein
LDNITHTLAGALIGHMGLKRRSRFAMAACLLGANAPDIDVFAPFFIRVDGIEFHRGPLHGVFAWPILAAGIVAILWMLDHLRPGREGSLPFRAGPLFIVTLLAVLTHPFLDWLTTYAIALLAPVNWRWDSGNAIFIIDWVYWLLMISGIAWSAIRWRRGSAHPGRPAQVAGMIMLAYIGFNLGESARVEAGAARVLRARGIEPTLVVASPPPLVFWERGILWRSADRFGQGTYDFQDGLVLDPASEPLRMDDPKLAAARKQMRYVRSFLVWSRMPIVVTVGGRTYLSDQRFYGALRSKAVPQWVRAFFRGHSFLVPLDNNGLSS